VGSGFLIALGAITLEEAWQAIDATTIVFLLSMMIVNANLTYAGFFPWILSFLLGLTRTPLRILIALTLSSGILSAIFLNDTVALILTPLTLNLTQALNLNPIPYLLALAAATNIGSVAPISGNPQNILIGSFSGITYLNFLKSLTPVAVAGMAIEIILLCLMYPEVRSNKPYKKIFISSQRIYQPLFNSLPITVLTLLFAYFWIH
jgi:Na+/H+ antiporter NhaD/arsenite permease-like protein